ncbi:hypothetical protein DFP73DRAFT_484846 [Morchella snyderi]|nr:hypothetical protein DFP73DRAFT_484846 [Morchella snyderi]
MPGAPPKFQYSTVGDGFGKTMKLYYGNPIEFTRYLLGQGCYPNGMVYRWEKIYDPDEYQLYSEMHTADWCWNTQEKQPPGALIVQL